MTTIPTTSTALPTPRRLARLAAVALSGAIVLGACGGPEAPADVAVATTEVTTTEATATNTGTDADTTDVAPIEVASFDQAVATMATGPAVRAISTVDTLEVFAAPDGAEVLTTLTDHTEFGSARVLLVEDAESTDGWIRVQLPVRPNESSGWVRAGDVVLEEVDALVAVDLEARRAAVWLDGELLLETSVAVGSADNPTPTGTFFVTDKIDTVNDAGAYGPFALGLSAHSDTLTEFAGGDGQIGLHGTDAPDSIGQAVSHGCVRLPNELIAVLAAELPLGTPVVIA